MPISTAGYRISQIPSYTAPDPRLVAFNPTAATDGFFSSIKIKAALDKLAADKAMQQELEATRIARIGSQNAQANRSIATDNAVIGAGLPGLEASTRVGQLAQTNALFKPQTESMLANLNLSKATAEGDLSIINQVMDAKKQSALASAGNSAIQVATQPDRLSQATSEARIGSRTGIFNESVLDDKLVTEAANTLANSSTAREKANWILAHPDATSMEMDSHFQEINDKWENGPDDMARRRKALDADIKLKESQARENATQAEALLPGGKLDRDLKIKEANMLRSDNSAAYMDLKRIGDLPTTNPSDPESSIKVSELKEALYDESPDGRLIPKKTGMLFKKNVRITPEANQLLAQYQNALLAVADTSRAIDENRKSRSGSGKTQIPAQAVMELRANPHLAKDFDAVFGAGSAASILK